MFTQEYIAFFDDLKQNNTRDWFNEHKKRYENAVKKPFQAFIQQLIDQIQITDPDILIAPKDAIFRINRDIRFSKDKTPYKMQMSAAISKNGKKGSTTPGLYIAIGADEVYLGSGAMSLNKDQLLAVRQHIINNQDAFQDIIESEDFKDTFGEVQGEKNKRLPSEMAEAAQEQALLYNKQFLAATKWEAERMLSPEFVEETISCYKKMRPFGVFLGEVL
ncbi:MAG: DUF2461 domain-containing protein [Bacteroidota bacterium]